MSIILLIFALLILGASFFWPQLWTIIQTKNSLAVVTQVRGQAEKISVHNSVPEKIKKNTVIQTLETLIVGNNSDLTVRFHEGAEVKLSPGSLVNFSGRAKNPQMNIKRGKLEIISISAQEKLWISQNGRTTKAQNYRTEEEPKGEALEINPVLNETEVQTDLNPISSIEGGGGVPENITSAIANVKREPAKKEEQSQIRTMISDRLARQKTRIYRCYSQLLQKKPEAKGKLAVHFTVNSLGKVEDAEMASTQFEDENFHKCLIEVVKRTDFLPFKGSTMATLLPLKFEKTKQ
jgi:hypothetical protein